MGALATGASSVERGQRADCRGQHLLPRKTQGRKLLDEAKQNVASWNYLGYAPGLKDRPVLIVRYNSVVPAESVS